MASETTQDYLKAIYKLGRDGECVATSAIAGRLRVTPASVTKMVKRLAEEGYLRHAPYQGVALTEAGEREALRVIRHHRLLELFLATTLGFSWDQVHNEAERLEHVISDEMDARMDAALGHPTVDPHGDPIPSPQGLLREERHPSLADTQVGVLVRVRRVSDADPERLRYLESLGLRLGAVAEVKEQSPFGGPLCIRVQDREWHIGRELAAQVFVVPAGGE